MQNPPWRRQVFRWAVKAHLFETPFGGRLLGFLPLVGFMILALAVFSLFAMGSLLVGLVVTLYGALALIALIFFFNATLLGVWWLMNIVGVLNRLDRSERLTLLRLTDDDLAVYWMLMMGTIQRVREADLSVGLSRDARLFLLVPFLLLGGVVALFLAGDRALVISLPSFILAYLLDRQQSLVGAGLLALVTHLMFATRLPLRIMGAALFVAMQLSVYTFVLICVLLSGVITDDSIIAAGIVTLLAVATSREAIIGVLWRVILYKLGEGQVAYRDVILA